MGYARRDLEGHTVSDRSTPDETGTEVEAQDQAQVDDRAGHDDRADRTAELAAELTAAAQALFEQEPDAQEGEELGGIPVIAVPLDEDGEVTDEGADAPADEDDADADADSETDADDDDADGSDPSDDEPEPAAPASSFGLIFQAPDLSTVPRRRSRRATSGVTAPVERPADEPAAEEDGVDASRDDLDLATDTDTDADGEGSTRGRRRRRGGKGRRTRVAGEEPQDDQPTESQEAEGDPVDQDAESGEGSEERSGSRRRRSRRGRGSAAEGERPEAGQAEEQPGAEGADAEGEEESGSSGTRRRRRRTRSGQSERSAKDEVTSVKGSTRLEAKRQRRREGREAGRRRTIITEAEFLARRESVDRVMVVRGLEDRTQIAVLEDGVPVEHYVSRSAQTTMVGNVYLGRVQNVLPSMEAAFVDIGKGRNAVLYAGEVNWDAAGLTGNEPKRIENALKSGEGVLVQVTKDPIGHKGARLTSQVSIPGRYLVYVPGSSMTGISRKLPDNERARLKKILKEVVPDGAGVIVRTAAEGASEAELRADVERLTAAWDRIQAKVKSANAPALLHGEPDMTVRVIRDVFNEDFSKLVVSGEQAWAEVKEYVDGVAPDLAERVEKYTGTSDVFTAYRVHEAIAKAMDRKVWLPSGGSLVIDRTEAMTVVDVNTGKFTGSGGNLEETVTKNNIEAAEEIVRQLRLRDIGGIIVVDFIDMVLESNRELVVRRLLECLGRDRTKHQVAEVTSLGLVQMTRKRVGSGLIEVFSETCTHCSGRGVVVHTEPVGKGGGGSEAAADDTGTNGSSRRGRGKGRGNGNGNGNGGGTASEVKNVLPTPNPAGPTPAQIAAAAHAAALQAGGSAEVADSVARATVEQVDAADESVEEVTAAATPEVVQDTAPVAEATAPVAEESAPVVEEPTPVVEEPAPVAEPAPAKRRRRGRVVAPAGPPTGDPGEPGSDTP